MICGLPCNCVLFETYNHIVGYPKSWYTFLYLYFHTHITIDWNVPKEWFKVYVSPKSNTQWSFRVSLFWIFPRKKHAGVNMIISVPLHWMSEGEFFRTYQRRGWRSGWNSRKGLQLTLPGKGRGDSEQLSLESLRKDWYAPWLEQGRNWWCSYPISHEIKKLHPKNDHVGYEYIMLTHTLPLKSFQQNFHNLWDVHFRWGLPGSFESRGQLTVGKSAASNPAESLRNPSCFNFKYNYCAGQKRAVFFLDRIGSDEFGSFVIFVLMFDLRHLNLDTCHW